MIEKYRATAAHKDTLELLKGYPAVISAEDLLLNLNNSTIASDGNGHKLYSESEEVSYNFGTGRFGQCSISIEQSTANFVTDSSFLDVTNFAANWETTPAGGAIDSDQPLDFSGATEQSISKDGFSTQTAVVESKNYISGTDGIAASDNLMQSCWVKTDATAIRFSIYSTNTGHHYDDYITLDSNAWTYVVMTVPYTILSADLVTGGEIQEFYIETSANATEINVFHPQTEINDFETSWTDSSRLDGELVYSNSYFTPGHFSIGGWFYIKNFSGDRNALFSICDDHDALYRLTAYTDNASSNEIIIKGAEIDHQIFDMSTGYEVVEDTWFHVFLTFDGINYKCYIDGELNTTTSDVRQLVLRPEATLYIGTWFDQDVLNGYANEFVVSSRVVEELGVNHLYTNEMPLYNPYQYIAQV